MKKYLIGLLIFFYSCAIKHEKIHCDNTLINNFNLGDIKTGHFIVAVEKCNYQNRSGFCLSLLQRLSPIIVEFDSTDILKSYKKGIFEYNVHYGRDTSLKSFLRLTNWKPPIAHLDQDTTFVIPFIKEDSTANLKLYSKRYFKTLINSKFYGKHNKPIEARHYYFEYDIFDITIKYIYAGKRCIVLPRSKNEYSSKNMFNHIEVPCYYIIEILEVNPYRFGHEYVIKF